MEAKAEGKGRRGILKASGLDGNPTNDTYFSKGRWEDEVDIHIRDVWVISDDDERHLPKIRAATEKAKRTILLRKAKGKRKAANQAGVEEKRVRDAAYMHRVVSDSDFW